MLLFHQNDTGAMFAKIKQSQILNVHFYNLNSKKIGKSKTDHPFTMETDILRHQNVKVARRYFWMGFLGLPFLWLVNYCYFKKVIDDPQCHPRVRLYALASRLTAVAAFILLIAWIATFWLTESDTWPDGLFLWRHEKPSL